MIHTIAPDFFQHYYPPKLVSSLIALEKRVQNLFLAGGAVRDLLLGDKPIDLDLAVAGGALEAARFFASHIKGKFVLLDEKEEVARVVWENLCIDFAIFREKTKRIEDDLRLRDFSINSMALAIRFDSAKMLKNVEIIDPCGGLSDLENGIITWSHEGALVQDPLRILRAYRFFSCLGFKISQETESGIAKQRTLLGNVSPERISYELHKIMGSNRAYDCFVLMAHSGVLSILFPEISAGQNLKQPGSHHLDVFEHNLAALKEAEKLMGIRALKSTTFGKEVSDYLKETDRKKRIKWAAFFHDLGKPAACKIREGKITFYGHDNKGSELFIAIAKRLKWSRLDTDSIAHFVKHHMWLFHLSNAKIKTGIKPKACLKIYRAFGEELPGLYILSLADSLAANGPDKPEGMEERLGDLYTYIRQVIKEKVDPVLSIPPVLTGKDLIDCFHLNPGPLFGTILSALEKEQVTNGIMTKEKALEWVGDYLKKGEGGEE